MRSAPRASPDRRPDGGPSADGGDPRPYWAIALLCVPVAAAAVLLRAGLPWQKLVLCLFAAGALVPLALPWLLHKPFDLFHPLAWVTLSILLGTTARSFYIALIDSETTQWLLDDRPLDELLPGVYVLFAACVCIGAGYWAAGKGRTAIERVPILCREWSLP